MQKKMGFTVLGGDVGTFMAPLAPPFKTASEAIEYARFLMDGSADPLYPEPMDKVRVIAILGHNTGLVQIVEIRTPVSERGQAERDANARLIAAAPELLEALRDLMNRHTYPDACECGACERAREVLRRVDGKDGER